MKRTTFRLRGVTLPEVLLGVSVLAFVTFGALLALVGTLAGWASGQARIQAEVETQRALRKVTDTLQEAMWAQVDADGMGIAFRLPQRDGSGNITFPLTWDGVERRIEIAGSDLRICDDAGCTTILTDVTTVDPNHPSGGSYLMFVPSAGTTVRQVTVQIVVNRAVRADRTIWARARESVRLRNVPQLF
ncbi:MAG: hypothetical protein AB1725_04220 [Armatimonadota bacterium]